MNDRRAGYSYPKPGGTILAGDFNRHHPLWEENRNHHMFTKRNLDAAQRIIDVTSSHDLIQSLPKDLPTFQSTSSKNWTRPDNVFMSEHLHERLIKCKTIPGLRPVCTDHVPIITAIDTEARKTKPPIRRNYRKVDWEEFENTLETKLSTIPIPKKIITVQQANSLLQYMYTPP